MTKKKGEWISKTFLETMELDLTVSMVYWNKQISGNILKLSWLEYDQQDSKATAKYKNRIKMKK